MTPFNRLLSIMLNPWVATGYLGLVFASFLYFDPVIALYFHDMNLRTNLPLLTWITHFGLGGFYFISLFSLALFFRYIKPNPDWEARSWFLWLCVLVPSVVCFFLKVTFGRARPDLLFRDNMYGFYGFESHSQFWSFPSGHSTTIMGLVFGLMILAPRYRFFVLIFGIVIASSRIFLTHHFLSDVLMAGYLALLVVGLLSCWLRRNNWLPSLNALRVLEK